MASEEGSIFSPEHRGTSVGVLLMMTLLAFEAMAVAAALPTATRDLHAVGAIGWAFTGFLAASLVGMVSAGEMCDRRGPRAPMLVGLMSFMAGLALSGSATSIEQFVAGRCVQGLGAGLLITTIYVVIGAAYPAALRPRLFAALSSAWVVPSLIGPYIAGTLAEDASWRWVFLGLLPLAVIGAALMVPLLRSSRAPAEPSATGDRRLLRALAVAGGVAALEGAGQHPQLLGLVPAVAGVAAVVWGLRTLLPPGTVSARPGVTAPIAMRGLLAGSLIGAEALIPLMLQVQHGYRPAEAALPLVFAGVTWAASSWWQGRPHHDDGPSRRLMLVRVGFAMVAAALVLAAVSVQPDVPGWLAYPAWGLAGLGAGLAMSSIGVLLLGATTDARRGADSAALQLSDSFCGAVTTGVGGVVVAAAARGVLGYTAAFTLIDVAMVAIASLGVAATLRAQPRVSVGAVARA